MAYEGNSFVWILLNTCKVLYFSTQVSNKHKNILTNSPKRVN